MKIFLFVFAATVFEAAGDAIVRIALHRQSLSARIGLFLLGYALLALYGTSLNLAPVEFAGVLISVRGGRRLFFRGRPGRLPIHRQAGEIFIH